MGDDRKLASASPIRYLALIVVLFRGAVAEEAATTRPEIWLALDAGGMLGLAQIGWLQWLEEQVMGSIYAAGACETVGAYGAPGSSRLPNHDCDGFVAETLFGPLFARGSLGDNGDRKAYFLPGKFL